MAVPSSISRWARLAMALSLVAALAVLAACGNDEPVDEPPPPDPPVEAPPEPPEEPDPPETARCVNEANGFAVEYPADWQTNPGDVAPQCSYFDPEPFEVPEAQEFFDAAIEIRREPVAFGAIAGEDPGTRVLEREDVEVAGRPAIRRETEATGDALLPAGTRAYQYLVDLDGETLVAATYDLDEHDFAENRDVLDRMIDSLELTR